MTLRRLPAVLAALSIAAGAAGSQPATAAPRDPLTVTGHGRGHGVGGSLAGYVNRATDGQTRDTILDFYFPGTAITRLQAGSNIRVGVYATAGTPITVAGGGGEPCSPGPWSPIAVTGAGVAMVAPDTQSVSISRDVASGVNRIERRRTDGSVAEVATTTSDVTVVDLAGGPVRILDITTPCFGRFREQLFLHWSDHGTTEPDDDRLWAVNALNIESYVRGVGEGPAAMPAAAAEALAVTARTYAWDKVEASRFKVEGFDISSSSTALPPGYPGGTQLYNGYDGERGLFDAAVEATALVIRTSSGEGAILASYAANGGPVTGDARFEFGSPTPVPYLVERADPFFRPSPDDDWTQIVNDATTPLALNIGDVSGFAIEGRTPGGRPARIAVFGTTGTAVVPAATFRAKLSLRSPFVDPPTVRLAGADRFATSAAVATEGHPGTVAAVVVASGDNAHLVDSLTAAPLAKQLGAPVLLASGGSVPAATGAELGRMRPARAFVVGGPASVPDSVVRDLQARGITVDRVAGNDRYETAARVAEAMGGTRPDAVIASGENGHLVDALAASGPAAALGRPILLTARDDLPGSTVAALQALGTSRTVVAGGPAAVSDAVLARLPSPTRVASANRYSTATALAGHFTPLLARVPGGLLRIGVASGESAHLVDALSAGSLGTILLLTPPARDAAVLAWLASQRLTFGRVLVLGGITAVPSAVETAVSSTVTTWPSR